MLEPISIGSYTNSRLVFERLNNELAVLQSEGFPFDIDIDMVGEITFMDCLLYHKEGFSVEDTFNTIKFSIANCLAEIIVEEWETLLIRKIVRDNFYYYNDEEKQAILNKAKSILNPTGLNPYHQHQRKEKVKNKILDYLEPQKHLVVEGFISFRLKDYQKELENIVNSAVDELLMEKEYLEFIRLLKYFVEIQEPRIRKVQVIFKQSGKFSLLDEENKVIKHECLEGLMVDMLESETNYEDLLISALITLAPQELVLHKELDVETGDAIKTIQNVFGNRVVNCSGCKKCRGKN
ncbi:MAG: putative sporulation protein YtxC [Clostridia bacterium]|nr:putative sporulation protein YtxC [Clostridia bacterium]MDD4146230.1 putative sporulation protein YtxC [Clostridia bacterium]MDD4665205.1 putative sporulation protein YtxC [Clostridia bacterium]